MLGHQGGLAVATWPTFDASVAKADEIVVPVQVNGKVRGRLTVSAEVTEQELEHLAMTAPRPGHTAEGCEEGRVARGRWSARGSVKSTLCWGRGVALAVAWLQWAAGMPCGRGRSCPRTPNRRSAVENAARFSKGTIPPTSFASRSCRGYAVHRGAGADAVLTGRDRGDRGTDGRVERQQQGRISLHPLDAGSLRSQTTRALVHEALTVRAEYELATEAPTQSRAQILSTRSAVVTALPHVARTVVPQREASSDRCRSQTSALRKQIASGETRAIYLLLGSDEVDSRRSQPSRRDRDGPGAFTSSGCTREPWVDDSCCAAVRSNDGAARLCRSRGEKLLAPKRRARQRKKAGAHERSSEHPQHPRSLRSGALTGAGVSSSSRQESTGCRAHD